MAKKRLTQEELVIAFNRYMPKRPVYPPLVYDEDILDNSSTESEGNDDEEEDISKRLLVTLVFKTHMTSKCHTAWEESTMKPPTEYLNDNIKRNLEIVLQKLINRKIKPKNPIEYLGFCLLNLNIKEPHVPNGDDKEKPSGSQLDFEISADIYPRIVRTGQNAEQIQQSNLGTTTECSVHGKRKRSAS